MKQIKQKVDFWRCPDKLQKGTKTIRNSAYITPKDEWYQLDNEWIFLTM